MALLGVSKSYRILVKCTTGQKQFSLNNQEFLNDKNITNIFLSGQSIGKNNEQPLLTAQNQFYITLYRENRIIIDLPSGMFAFAGNTANLPQPNILSLEKLGRIDWQQSQITFPENLVANTNLELIVMYQDPS